MIDEGSQFCNTKRNEKKLRKLKLEKNLTKTAKIIQVEIEFSYCVDDLNLAYPQTNQQQRKKAKQNTHTQKKTSGKQPVSIIVLLLVFNCKKKTVQKRCKP